MTTNAAWPVYPKRADVDELAVEHAVAGLVAAKKLTTAEKILAVRQLASAGYVDREIADRMKWPTENAVNQFRMRWQIPSGRSFRRRAA